MVKKRYKVPFRRRREGKTDYHRRLKLLISHLPRLAVRISNRYITAQLIKYKPEGDVILGQVNSKILKKFGWPYSCKNTPAAYLTGYYLGLKLKNSVQDVIVDIGLRRSTRGNRIYACVKGAIDAGLNVRCDESMFPTMERIKGVEISKYAEKLKAESEDLYEKRFSMLLSYGVDPSKIPDVFEETKKKIEEVIA